MRALIIVVLLFGASLAAFWLFDVGDDRSRYELIDGRVVRIDPYGNRTSVGPAMGTRSDTSDDGDIEAPRPREIAPGPDVATLPAPPRDGGSEPIGVIARPPPKTPEAPTIVNFRTYDNRDLDGGDFGTFNNLDLQGCATACKIDTRCRAYSFDRWNRFCFLKSAIGVLRMDPRSITSIRADAPKPAVSTTEITMQRFRGKAFPGAGYKTFKTAAFAACETACRNDEFCIAYTFQKKDLICRVYDTAGEYFTNAQADSGAKLQER